MTCLTRAKICLVAAMIFFISAMVFTSTASADQNSAQSAISSAQSNFKNCYQAVKQAQAAGANVNQLMTTLNNSSALLSKSQLAYASGDYNSAYTYANQCQNELNGFVSQANALQANAANSRNSRYLIDGISIIASIAILCVGIAAWSHISRKGRKV